MNKDEIIKEINSHKELAAQLNERGEIEVEKIDSSSIGDELICDYIERIVGSGVMKQLKLANADESSSVATFTC